MREWVNYPFKQSLQLKSMWDNILNMISSSSLNTSFCDQTERTHRMLLLCGWKRLCWKTKAVYMLMLLCSDRPQELWLLEPDRL